METTAAHLEAHGVKPTAVRILVWEQCAHIKKAFALSDIEANMPVMDRSSIFRALRLFAEHHMLHAIDDGTGRQKYCVCRCHDAKHHLNHVHFTCLACGRTYCLEDHTIPVVDLPDGFSVEEAEYVIKGICPNCK